MKKKLGFVLAMLLLTFSLGACQKAEKDLPADTQPVATTESAKTTEPAAEVAATPAPDQKLVFAWWGNQTRNERTQAALDLYTVQNPNITFDGQFAAWADYWNKLATASAGHSLPDVIQMDYSYLNQYVSNNLLVDLTPYTQDGTLDISKMDPGIVASGSVDGKLYAVCIGLNAPALVYNKTLLADNGIAIKDNMTMDDYFTIAREVYEKTGYKTSIAYSDSGRFLDYFLRGEGKQLYKDGKLGVESAADFETFFNLYATGMEEGWLVDASVYAERQIGSVEQSTLVYGSSPETLTWADFFFSNQLTAIQAAAPAGTEIGITTWPSTNPKLSNFLKPGQFLSVSVDSKDPQASTKVLDYWTNAIDCNEILLAERGVPASSEVAAALAPKLDEVSQVITNYINDVVTPNCSAINPPDPQTASQFYEAINQIEEQLCYGQIDAKTAAQQLFEQGNQILTGN